VGIFMAVKLTKIFRVWPHSEERITLTGHWQILAALTASTMAPRSGSGVPAIDEGK
jgi:hypothetical protein